MSSSNVRKKVIGSTDVWPHPQGPPQKCAVRVLFEKDASGFLEYRFYLAVDLDDREALASAIKLGDQDFFWREIHAKHEWVEEQPY